MKTSSKKGISTTIAAIVIILILVAAAAAIYVESQSVRTATTTLAPSTVTSTATSTATSVSTATSTATSVSTATSTATTTATTTSVSTSTVSATSSGSIPANTLVIGQTSPQWGTAPVGTDPDDASGCNVGWTQANYEEIFQMDPAQMKSAGTYVAIPWLATNATKSADGLTYVINLQSGVHFHTGNVMTARDVQWSLDRAIFFPLTESMQTSVCSGWSVRGIYASWKNVSVTAPLQIAVTLNYPDPLFYSELTSEQVPIMDSTVLQSHAVTINGTSDLGYAWLNAGQDVGTGPFMLTSWTTEQRISFTKFSQYWGGVYNVNTPVQTVTFIPIADPTTARFELEKGQINVLADATPDVLSSLINEGGWGIVHAPGFLSFNLNMHTVGPLADWRVRDALKASIDYKGILKAATFGLDTVDDSQFYAGMPGFNNATATYWAQGAPNITGAKELLAEAGYPNGFTINLYTRPSERYGITFVTVAQILQADWAAIGVKAVINVYVSGQFYALDENVTIPGIWNNPNSLSIFSPESNFQSTLGAQRLMYTNWYVNGTTTEKGPGVNFTWLFNTYQQSLKETNATKQIQEMQAVDTYYIKYGPYEPLIQISSKAAYALNIQGMLWNAFEDVPDITYLSFS